MAEADCLFCKIRDQKIPAAVVYRDEHVLAFKDITPRAPLHLLVIPTRHIASLSDARPADADVMGRLMVTAAQLARDAGQTVFHVHLHLLAGRPLAWPPG